MLTYTFPNGTKIEVPESILILENFGQIEKNTHYKLKLGTTYSGEIIFDVTHKNGKDIQMLKMYLSLTTILNLIYKACTLEQFHNMKVFL